MPHTTVTVYWRPGCGFCGHLLQGLGRTGVAFEQVDIWRDPDAAAVVRSVAGGNETVPTVLVGDVALVNPRVDDVLHELAGQDPEALPGGYEPASPTMLAHAHGQARSA